jgi:hypothetical protein
VVAKFDDQEMKSTFTNKKNRFHAFYTGGPIISMEWIPQTEQNPILSIYSHSRVHVHTEGVSSSGDSYIQFWQINLIEESFELLFVLQTNSGAIWDMKWLPRSFSVCNNIIELSFILSGIKWTSRCVSNRVI